MDREIWAGRGGSAYMNNDRHFAQKPSFASGEMKENMK